MPIGFALIQLAAGNPLIDPLLKGLPSHQEDPCNDSESFTLVVPASVATSLASVQTAASIRAVDSVSASATPSRAYTSIGTPATIATVTATWPAVILPEQQKN